MKKILLIVDDEEIVYQTLSAQFNQNEVEILSVGDGEEGLQVAIKNHPDLILLDIIMPKMDGVAMLNKLRQDTWGKQAKVIVLSNNSDTDKIKEVEGHGVYEYLIKANLDAVDMAKKIKEVLSM
jgi:CheY-like chemotaxis protein